MAGFGGLGALFANLLQPAGMAAAGGTQGVVEGNEEARKLAIENLRQQLLAGQLDLQRMQMTQGKVMDVGGRLVQVAPNGQVTVLPMPPGPLSPVQEAQIGLSKARTKESEARVKEIETRGVGKGSIPAEHIRLFEDWQATHPGGSYLDFYKENIKPPHAAGEPKSLESLITAANDPRLPKEERERAAQAAKAIEGTRTRIQAAGAGVREDAAIRREERAEARTIAKEQRKVDSHLGPMNVAINQMESVLPALQAKGFLPNDVGWYEQARALYIQKKNRNDPDWVKWITNQGALIGIDRSVYNDMGRGGQMMYSAVKEFSEHPPTMEAARAAFAQWREAIAAQKGQGAGVGGGGQRRVRVRDPKTKREGWATLGPGESLPAGLEEVK